jgi:hypothetical protein
MPYEHLETAQRWDSMRMCAKDKGYVVYLNYGRIDSSLNHVRNLDCIRLS